MRPLQRFRFSRKGGKMRLLILLFFCLSSPAIARTTYLKTGNCIVINGHRICAIEQRGFERESYSTRKNIFCSCEYGFNEVKRAGDPTKGYWLYQFNYGTKTTIKNFGGDKRACEQALNNHPGCEVGVVKYQRTRRR